MASNLQIEAPNFDRIRKGDDHATEDAVRLLWLVQNNEISMRQQTVQQATNQWSPKVLASPASSQQDNFDARDTVWLVFTSASPFAITGIRNGVEGRTLLIENLGTGAVTLAYESAASDAPNRFYTRLGTNHVLGTGQTALLGYLNQRWRVASPVVTDITTGYWTDVAANSSYFAVGGPGAGNWTPGTIGTYAYTLVGKTLHLQIYCTGGTWSVGGGSLNVLLPAGLTAARYAKGSAFLTNVAMAYETCLVHVAPSGTWAYLYRNGLAAFPAGASVSMFLELTASVT